MKAAITNYLKITTSRSFIHYRSSSETFISHCQDFIQLDHFYLSFKVNLWHLPPDTGRLAVRPAGRLDSTKEFLGCQNFDLIILKEVTNN